MKRLALVPTAVCVAAAVMLLLAAASPLALAGVRGGLWEVSRSANGANGVRQCLADPTALSQWEHRGQNCTRVVISDDRAQTVIHYTCANGNFGRSVVEPLTPRALRIETQGISDGFPFAYVLHARRIGPCR